MKLRLLRLAGPLLCAGLAVAQESTFSAATRDLDTRLEQAVAELDRLRQETAAEMIPLNQRLRALEDELSQARQELQDTTRTLDGRTLDLSTLGNEIQARRAQASYISGRLGEYLAGFESRLHIAEVQRYQAELEAAKLAPENSLLSQEQIYAAQTGMVAAALERLHGLVAGSRFEGTAVDAQGTVKRGTFVLVGPSALFRSDDGTVVGTVEQRLGSLQPTVMPFGLAQDAARAGELVSTSAGRFPLDPSLGNARKVEETRETLGEHIRAGGPVMIPIFVLAGLALLVVLYKWLSMAFIARPRASAIQALFATIARRDREGAVRAAQAIKGPTGAMLLAGAQHLAEPRELIEELMYEKVLATRLKLQNMLPFVAISASSAPLLGLLGTVTGIMQTFKLITVFGTGDVKTLSSGISEALITTEYGLIVAIPSLLLHAFLARKARKVVDDMEKAAIGFLNEHARSAPDEKAA